MRQHSAPKSPYCACAIGRRAAYCQPAIDAQKVTVSAKPIGSASKKKRPYCRQAIGSTNKRDEKNDSEKGKKEKEKKRKKKRQKAKEKRRS